MVPCCAGLRLQSVRQLLMQQAAIPPLFHLGSVEPPEKRTSPTSGRIVNLTAHAGALPAAGSAGTSQSLLALPARAATWGAMQARGQAASSHPNLDASPKNPSSSRLPVNPLSDGREFRPGLS